METSKFKFNKDEIDHLVNEFDSLAGKVRDLINSNDHIFSSHDDYCSIAKIRAYKSMKALRGTAEFLTKVEKEIE